ncbi:unnamed protein product [Mytilus coruscus]|uniref:C1q domain-containing protein n=1 Tax=Mytilus coruscus TaxID=42192 RepID=A0A6J8ABR1_MYTCO|nr:unnamed protein product [Mytilus coruscus]
MSFPCVHCEQESRACLFELDRAKYEKITKNLQRIIAITKDITITDIPVEFSYIWNYAYLLQWPKDLGNLDDTWRKLAILLTDGSTVQLEYRVDVLQQTVYSVQVINAQIELKQVLTENIKSRKSRNLEKNITGLKQLQSVSDLQSILVLQNKTTNIEIKQQHTENILQSVISSANTRSQDFIALLNKLKISDNRTIELQAILSVDAVSGAVPSSGVIPFKSLHTFHGIKNLTSVKINGKFTCESAGIYLISVYVSTNSKVKGYCYIYKNANYITYVFTDSESYYHTRSATVVTNLGVGDTVFIKNRPSIYMDRLATCLSIIQIKEL